MHSYSSSVIKIHVRLSQRQGTSGALQAIRRKFGLRQFERHGRREERPFRCSVHRGLMNVQDDIGHALAAFGGTPKAPPITANQANKSKTKSSGSPNGLSVCQDYFLFFIASSRHDVQGHIRGGRKGAFEMCFFFLSRCVCQQGSMRGFCLELPGK